MAKRELGPASLQVAQAVAAAISEEDVVVGCSGGADSLSLALGTRWVAERTGIGAKVVVIDHRLQAGSAEVAQGVVDKLAERGMDALLMPVKVNAGNLEAEARKARLSALASFGRPVLLGHTLDDQAETVLLGLARGSGPRSLAGMAPRRGPFLRPLLGLRRTVTEQACREWGIEPWLDPHNLDHRFARVRVRTRVLPVLEDELGPGIAEALARTAELVRIGLKDDAPDRGMSEMMDVAWLVGLAPAERGHVVKMWLESRGAVTVGMVHVQAVTELVTDWRGQKWVNVPGGRVVRRDGKLIFIAKPGTHR